MRAAHISKDRPLMLGSASPRRAQLLSLLGLPLLVRSSNVAEDQLADDTPDSFLERVAQDKLAAGLLAPDAARCACVLAADTIVVVDGQILGKPRDREEAFTHITRLAGRSHTVSTRYAIGAVGSDRIAARTVSTTVTLRTASAAELRGYAETGEGLDKAGGYALQGLGSFLVTQITGSPSNVIGLPQSEVVSDLLTAGFLDSFPAVF